MPRDQRLYMTFPNDIHRHPKVRRLSVEARWAFVEMNGEARIADNDGVFTVADARYHWTDWVLAELVNSHPTRPLLTFDEMVGVYRIRDYAEHQQTRTEREELRARRAEAGAKGGAATASKRLASAKQVPSKLQQTPAESESESEIPDLTNTYKSQSLDNRASVSTDVSSITVKLAAQNGIPNLAVVAAAILEHTGRTVSLDEAWQVAHSLLQKARQYPARPLRYVTGAISQSPFEVQQFIDAELGA